MKVILSADISFLGLISAVFGQIYVCFSIIGIHFLLDKRKTLGEDTQK
jgi:hypothetical protein